MCHKQEVPWGMSSYNKSFSILTTSKTYTPSNTHGKYLKSHLYSQASSPFATCSLFTYKVSAISLYIKSCDNQMLSAWWYSPSFQPMKYMTFAPSQSLVIMMLSQLWLSSGGMFSLASSCLMPSSWLLDMFSNSRITQIVAMTKIFYPSVLRIVKIKPNPYMLKKKIPKLRSQTFYIGRWRMKWISIAIGWSKWIRVILATQKQLKSFWS